jgi:hypothetical protein
MKKFLFVSGMLLLALGCNRQANNPYTGAANNAPTTNSEPPSNSQPQLQGYANSTYGVSLQYPAGFTFTDVTYANLDQKIVQFALDRSNYPGTNFSDAGVAISMQTAASLKQCLQINLPENATGFKETRDINGTAFYTGQSAGVGAGNIYTSRVYRAYRNNSCYEIDETIHTSNIGNYEPGTIKEVDPDTVWDRLDQVGKTFKFSN